MRRSRHRVHDCAVGWQKETQRVGCFSPDESQADCVYAEHTSAMASVHTLPPDTRPSALYLIAHQGPLKRPRPVEIQHMRIRRYMDLLGELRGIHHHYRESEDIYVDFNFTGAGEFPGLMRLGEAIAQHRYRAVFVDLAGPASFTGSSPRDQAISRAEYTLGRLPVEVIDVSRDPAGVLKERLEELCGRHAQSMIWSMQDGSHDMVCFFPGLAADVAAAVFYRHEDREGPVAETIRRRIDLVEEDNPYRAGAVPSIPETLWRVYGERHREDQQQAAEARRASGETVYRIEPDGKPLLREEGLWSVSARSDESMAAAEARLAAFGFEKVTGGPAVSYRRETQSGDLLLADPRREGNIEIIAFRLEQPKGKRGKPRWVRQYPSQTVLDRWWKTDTAVKAAEFLAKHFGGEIPKTSAMRGHRVKRERE